MLTKLEGIVQSYFKVISKRVSESKKQIHEQMYGEYFEHWRNNLRFSADNAAREFAHRLNLVVEKLADIKKPKVTTIFKDVSAEMISEGSEFMEALKEAVAGKKPWEEKIDDLFSEAEAIPVEKKAE